MATEEQRAKALSQMQAGPFTLKKTVRKRLLDLDLKILLIAQQIFPSAITVHDMAASDGITSLDLFNLLTDAMPGSRVRSSDYYDALWVAQRGPFWLFFDRDKRLLQVALGRLALRSEGANHFLARILSPDVSSLTRVPLLHPDVITKAAADERFTVGGENFFAPEQTTYDVVRVMNALTERNFPRSDIERAVKAIAPTVAAGGLLVLGRSADEIDGRSQATIFQNTGKGFVALEDLGGGYALREFVLSM